MQRGQRLRRHREGRAAARTTAPHRRAGGRAASGGGALAQPPRGEACHDYRVAPSQPEFGGQAACRCDRGGAASDRPSRETSGRSGIARSVGQRHRDGRPGRSASASKPADPDGGAAERQRQPARCGDRDADAGEVARPGADAEPGEIAASRRRPRPAAPRAAAAAARPGRGPWPRRGRARTAARPRRARPRSARPRCRRRGSAVGRQTATGRTSVTSGM